MTSGKRRTSLLSQAHPDCHNLKTLYCLVIIVTCNFTANLIPEIQLTRSTLAIPYFSWRTVTIPCVKWFLLVMVVV
jgi:hypothetical protein